MPENKYVLITAAYNEEKHIGNTIESVLGQTLKPLKWIIVSDGSTDSTDSIVRHYVENCGFIEFIRREKTDAEPGFISKVMALKVGHAALKGMSYSLIGILDADVSFGPEYYENIITILNKYPKLGIGGGFIYEPIDGQFKSRPTNTESSVAGAIQLFRRDCYEAIGGHHPARFGGEDTICEIMARMKGWRVQAFADLAVYHPTPSLTKRGIFKDAIRQGRLDYSIGSHPAYEIVKCIRRSWIRKPYVLFSLLRICGYFTSFVMRDKRVVSSEVINYLQREQLGRIIQIFSPTVSDLTSTYDVNNNKK